MSDTIKNTNATTQQHQQQNNVDLLKFNLKDETIYKLVDHSVGAIALECGYYIAHQASLDILTDVCCDYLRKIATLLRVAHDTQDLRDGESDFSNSLERVFHQINVPSSANLHQFVCKMEAIKKHQGKIMNQQRKSHINERSTMNNEEQR